LNLENPKLDLTKKLDVDDFRFIGLYGFSTYFPGVENNDLEFIDRYGSRILEGTSDSIESEDHGKLITIAEDYAKTYNITHLIHLKSHNCKPIDGYVPDEETAIKIAVAVWSKIYGKNHIAEQKPYIASFKDGIWHISGTLPPKYDLGGTAYAEIIKESGKIIRVSHGK
jgi:hypothetical protein